MGRRERTLDAGAGPLQAFAGDLRDLRRRAGSPTYQALAAKAYCSKSALSAAASGETLPSLSVTLAYVEACGGNVTDWERRWRALEADLMASGEQAVATEEALPEADNRQPAVVSRRQRLASPDDVAERLARAILAQWNAEAEVRGLNHPLPLPVRWLPAEPAGPSKRGRLTGHFAEVADAFERMAPQRLVVIGEPGAGKTVLAIQLVRDLIKRRRPGEPVPVLLPIASWDPRTEHLHRWIAARLEETYPALRASTGTRATLALQLVQTNRILPVLDGLDEMAAELRPCAIRGLNRAFGSVQPVVVTCRAEEYRQTVAPVSRHDRTVAAIVPAVEPLAGAAVVELRPIRAAEAEAYLRDATPAPDVPKWAPVFAHLAGCPDGPLGQALSTPLMVSLARTAYCETTATPSSLLERDLFSRVDIENHLIDRLIPAVYSGAPRPDRRPQWSAGQAQAWLGFLARHLDRLGTRDLAWWRLPEAISSTAFRFTFAALTCLTIAVAVGIPVTALGGPAVGLRQITFGLMFGLAALLTVNATSGRGAPAVATFAGRVRPILAGLIGGLAGGFAYALADAPMDGWTRGLIFGLGNGLTVGLTVGLTSALASPSPARVHVRLRTGFRGFARPVTVALAFGLAIGVVGGSALGPPINALQGLAVGLVTGLLSGLRGVLGVPTDITSAASPSSVWRADRAVAATHALVFGLIAAPSFGVMAAIITGSHVGISLGLTYGLIYALAGAASTAWYRFLVARACLSLGGRLPWALMAFLSDAHRRGLLRQVGAQYQFRHARLQDRLGRPR